MLQVHNESTRWVFRALFRSSMMELFYEAVKYFGKKLHHKYLTDS